MPYFVVNFCDLKACQSWRLGDKCAKNGFDVKWQIAYLTDLHNSNICEIRRQVDQYRLNQLLEK